MSKENTAVFIGHNECYGVTSEQIKEAIVSLIDKGVTEFLSGGQGGFDRLYIPPTFLILFSLVGKRYCLMIIVCFANGIKRTP